MDKFFRKAVRTYLIKDGKVVVIKYKTHDEGFFDIPGGKIENGETSEETSAREFREETGITVLKQHYIGHSVVEYPDRIYDFDVFVVDEHAGEPAEFDENYSMWMNIEDLFKEKVFPSVVIIKDLKDGMDVRVECDTDHNIKSYTVYSK